MDDFDKMKEQKDAMAMVHVVECHEPHGHFVVHIFSTAARAAAFCDADPRPHVCYDYAVDFPERCEQPCN